MIEISFVSEKEILIFCLLQHSGMEEINFILFFESRTEIIFTKFIAHIENYNFFKVCYRYGKRRYIYVIFIIYVNIFRYQVKRKVLITRLFGKTFFKQ